MSPCNQHSPTFGKDQPVFVSVFNKQAKTIRKRYDCNQCSKYFTRPSALQTHIYTHTGEKPHKCEAPGCGRRFAVISNLRRHLRVHRPANARRRLSSQARREYVEKLIKKSSVYEGHANYNTFPPVYYSSSSESVDSSTPSPTSSPCSSHRSLSPIGSTYRLLKPKDTRPLCLTVHYLLN